MRSAVFVLATFLGGTTVLAASGTVRDDRGRTLAGAQACLVVDHVDVLCVTTIEDGYYRLPGGEAKGATVRVSANGFLPVEVAAVDQTAAIVLQRAAAFRARLVDATDGTPLSEGHVWIVESTGRRIGPLPVNRAGVEISTFLPGRYRFQGEAPGRIPAVVEVDLVAGQARDIELRLRAKGGTSN